MQEGDAKNEDDANLERDFKDGEENIEDDEENFGDIDEKQTDDLLTTKKNKIKFILSNKNYCLSKDPKNSRSMSQGSANPKIKYKYSEFLHLWIHHMSLHAQLKLYESHLNP